VAEIFDTLITNAMVIDPEAHGATQVGILGGLIAALLGRDAGATARTVIDASGSILLPGLVDAHAHLREPGLTHKEDFASAGRAAVAGGITTIVVMPHDDPVAGSAELLAEKAELGTAATVDFALGDNISVVHQHNAVGHHIDLVQNVTRYDQIHSRIGKIAK